MNYQYLENLQDCKKQLEILITAENVRSANASRHTALDIIGIAIKIKSLNSTASYVASAEARTQASAALTELKNAHSDTTFQGVLQNIIDGVVI